MPIKDTEDRDNKIIEMYHREGDEKMTLQEIADEVGLLSRERIRQIVTSKSFVRPKIHRPTKEERREIRAKNSIKRFWERTETKENGCIEWSGGKFPSGYGVCQMTVVGGKDRIAHRISWRLAHGNIPDGMYVCHKCDNRLCVNPEHLYLGTALENNRDREIRKRGNHLKNIPRKNFSASIKRSIVRKYKQGQSITSLSVEYFCNVSTILCIVQPDKIREYQKRYQERRKHRQD